MGNIMKFLGLHYQVTQTCDRWVYIRTTTNQYDSLEALIPVPLPRIFQRRKSHIMNPDITIKSVHMLLLQEDDICRLNPWHLESFSCLPCDLTFTRAFLSTFRATSVFFVCSCTQVVCIALGPVSEVCVSRCKELPTSMQIHDQSGVFGMTAGIPSLPILDLFCVESFCAQIRRTTENMQALIVSWYWLIALENRICNRSANFLPVFLNSSRTEIVKSFSNCITHVVIDLRIVILTAPRISDKIHLAKENCQGNVNKSFSPTEIRLILPNCSRDVEFLLSRVYLRLHLVMEVFSSIKLLLNPCN